MSARICLYRLGLISIPTPEINPSSGEEIGKCSSPVGLLVWLVRT